MLNPKTAAQRRELGHFIRAQRERLAPAAFGLPAGARRRTPGLRREEVAQLSGLSATWYTWIEQGRDVSISPPALARLVGAFRLGRAERAYLFDLAGRRDPEENVSAGEAIPAALQACVAVIGAPAYVLDRSWTAQCWNTPAKRLFAPWLDKTGPHNLLRFIFLEPAARKLICDWPDRARRVVAEFRAECGPHLADPAIRALIDELRRQSRAFARLWEQHGVLGREGGLRTFNHPRDGFLRYEQTSFNLASQPELKLTVLMPSDASSRK
jgi:transcriptional regulator with XRE-family HTH domain